MPKRVTKRSAKISSASIRRTAARGNDTSVNFTFFNSKMFLTLVAIALLVIIMAVFSSMNNSTQKPMSNGDSNYRIDTSNLQNDSSATDVMP